MSAGRFVSPDAIRTRFSQAMSEMYRAEVPQYGTLLQIVGAVNARILAENPAFAAALARSDNLDRISLERHGAIRLGTSAELSGMRRLFAVMGMHPVGYYDLSVAGVPVHSTAFRPITEASLARNPFRVFTSLLRLELIEEPGLRQAAEELLARRRIFTEGAWRLIARAEQEGGLIEPEAEQFVTEAIETFRWQSTASVDAVLYARLHEAHRLIADVVCFRGPHINHLTPRTLDIDRVQKMMPQHGLAAKAVIEGPPRRACPLLLRQTSFLALEEPILFPGADGALVAGTHTARFGEIEQRGMALTRAGRALYDRLLAAARDDPSAFTAFPDDEETIRAERLGFFRYSLARPAAPDEIAACGASLARLIEAGILQATPLIYEDFLPVSAAGIFQSNLGGTELRSYAGQSMRGRFEEDLGAPVLDEFALYEEMERATLLSAFTSLGLDPEQIQAAVAPPR